LAFSAFKNVFRGDVTNDFEDHNDYRPPRILTQAAVQGILKVGEGRIEKKTFIG
jgi:hypothetical protein